MYFGCVAYLFRRFVILFSLFRWESVSGLGRFNRLATVCIGFVALEGYAQRTLRLGYFCLCLIFEVLGCRGGNGCQVLSFQPVKSPHLSLLRLRSGQISRGRERALMYLYLDLVIYPLPTRSDLS